MSNELHAAIMNLPLGDVAGLPRDIALYKQGHQDARHAAAELALSRDSEVERLREDAERYRWLRDRAMHTAPPCPWVVYGNDGSTADPTYGTELDSVVDAARAALHKEPK